MDEELERQQPWARDHRKKTRWITEDLNTGPFLRLGELVRDARRARGVSQRELAEMIGSQQSSVSHVERGFPVNIATVDKVLAGLGWRLTIEQEPLPDNDDEDEVEGGDPEG